MPILEDVLFEKTFKQGLDVERRVFYTLTDESNGCEHQAHRNSKAIALLFKVLCEKHHITDAQLDEILLEVVS